MGLVDLAFLISSKEKKFMVETLTAEKSGKGVAKSYVQLFRHFKRFEKEAQKY